MKDYRRTLSKMADEHDKTRNCVEQNDGSTAGLVDGHVSHNHRRLS